MSDLGFEPVRMRRRSPYLLHIYKEYGHHSDTPIIIIIFFFTNRLYELQFFPHMRYLKTHFWGSLGIAVGRYGFESHVRRE